MCWITCASMDENFLVSQILEQYKRVQLVNKQMNDKPEIIAPLNK